MKKIFSRIGFYTFAPFGVLTLLSTLGCFRTVLFAEQKTISKPLQADFIQKTQKLRIPFIANEGQINNNQIRFYANTFWGTIFVTKEGGIVYSLPNSKDGKKNTFINRESSLQNAQCRFNILHHASGISYQNCTCCLIANPNTNADKHHTKAIALKEEFVDGKIDSIQGLAKAVTKVNYFKGKDQSSWMSSIPTYDSVTLGEVYRGIGLKLKAYGNNVEKLFCVSPNANPEVIKIKLNGANALRVDEEGQLEAETDLGKVKFTKPFAYQEIDGRRLKVDVEYRILNQKSEHIYSFKVASYDKTKELIIDPLLASTFLGGSRESYPWESIAIDSEGNIYVAGSTPSSDFPTTVGVYDTSYNGGDEDVFVSKLSGDLTSLLASTYLGGSERDGGRSIALDSSGNVYITGSTVSLNFPTTIGAYDTSHNSVSPGYTDVFVSKLNPGLTKLLASTYLGGSSLESGNFITSDSSGNIYVAGSTSSSDFPITNGAYDTSYNGFYYDAFVSKLNADLTSLLASTYLGGSGGDNIYSMTMNSNGDIYVTGPTESSNFPTTYNAYDTSFNSYVDAFVSRLNSGLTNLLSSTYLGGTSGDYGYCIGIDLAGNVYVAGLTYSSDFPTTSGAYDTTYNGGIEDAFVSKLNGNLTNLLASTYLGGSHDDQLLSMAIDRDGNIFVTGWTTSKDFPTTTGAYDTSHNDTYDGMDAFVSKINGLLTDLLASTYLGGAETDQGYSLAVDSSDNVYVAGYTVSSNFPITDGAYDTSINNGAAFVSKLDNNLSKLPPEAITESATNITSDSATLNGIVNANGLSTTIWFQYGTTSGSYTHTSTTQSVNGFDDTVVNIGISGLSAETTYYYRIVAQNSAGTSNGNEMSFTTSSGKGGILGYVLDTKGNPINRARLRLEGIETLISQYTVSDSKGFYSFSDIDAGAYAIISGKRGYKISKQKVILGDGEQKEIEIQLEKR